MPCSLVRSVSSLGTSTTETQAGEHVVFPTLHICLMFRSTPLRSILSRTSVAPTTPVADWFFRPFARVAPRSRYASTIANSRTTSLPVLLGALTCTLLGYTIGSSVSLPSPLVSLGLGHRQASTEDVEPTYGTPEDFQKAIQELRHTFGNEGRESGVVSTDPDDLRIHGFSENDHHPGVSVSTPIVLHSNRFTLASGDRY
jgi:D-lactate dehydrogenase (cytochrome)